MITVKDVKVKHKSSDQTQHLKWENYFFQIGKLNTFGITKENGIFRFYAKHCKTLQEAKEYIAEYLNNGGNIQSI